jgi:hypothetical protein
MQVTPKIFLKDEVVKAQDILQYAILDALQQSRSSKSRWIVGLNLPTEGEQSISTQFHNVIGAWRSYRTRKLGSYVS